MTPDDVVRLVERLEDEVNNDGFDGFFFNSAGDDAAETIVALDTIGAHRTSAIVRRACARFPGGMPPTDRDSRQTVLLAVVAPGSSAFESEDAAFLAYEEDLASLLEAYRSTH